MKSQKINQKRKTHKAIKKLNVLQDGTIPSTCDVEALKLNFSPTVIRFFNDMYKIYLKFKSSDLQLELSNPGDHLDENFKKQFEILKKCWEHLETFGQILEKHQE